MGINLDNGSRIWDSIPCLSKIVWGDDWFKANFGVLGWKLNGGRRRDMDASSLFIIADQVLQEDN